MTCSGDPRLMPSCSRPPEMRSADAGVLGHVERVLVAHVDDAGADLDPAGPRADGGEQRERRGELVGEVVHPEVRAVGAELLGGDREVDRLQQHVGRPTASASAARASSARTTGTRCASWRLERRRPPRSSPVPFGGCASIESLSVPGLRKGQPGDEQCPGHRPHPRGRPDRGLRQRRARWRHRPPREVGPRRLRHAGAAVRPGRWADPRRAAAARNPDRADRLRLPAHRVRRARRWRSRSGSRAGCGTASGR